MPTTRSQITRSLLLLALALVVSTSARATDLSGKVTEVIDGNTVNLKSLSHTIKVRLLAVAPPDQAQPYADVARKHLADLILEKYVVVRYTGIGEKGYLVGRILLEQADINAQMLRDGVAWYYRPDADDLAPNDRELYPACESAARSERRGLWQDQAPIAPWEFRKAQVPQMIPATANAGDAPTRAPAELHVPRSKRTSLSSEDMMGGGTLLPGTLAGKIDIKPFAKGSAPDTWVRFQPADRHFSILAPSGGLEQSAPVLNSLGKLTRFHYLQGEKEGSFYAVEWAKGPIEGGTPNGVAAYVVNSVVTNINRYLERAQLGYKVAAKPVRDVKLGEYVGHEYKLTSPYYSGVLRVVSKPFGDERETFLLVVLYQNEFDGQAFLNSFKVIADPAPEPVAN